MTHVDRIRDGVLPGAFRARNAVEAGAWAGYDADAMHGLPVGVQVVGRRYEEEKVIEGMKLVERLLAEQGEAYGDRKRAQEPSASASRYQTLTLR